MIAVIIETSFLLLLPLVLVLDYLYFAGLRAWVEGLRKGFRLSVFTGFALLWISFVPGPVAALGAFVVTLALVILAFFNDVKAGIKNILKMVLPSKFFRLVKEGCVTQEGCAARYLAAWPALAALATTTEVVTAPITMFVLGYISKPPRLKGKLARLNKLVGLIMIIIAWTYAILNTIRNLLLPQWLLMQEYALSGEVSKLPVSARIMASIFGKEAAYVYTLLLIILAVYTASRIHSSLKLETRREVIASIAPFVAYAVSMNKLGEPLTSITYAIGITLAYILGLHNITLPSSVTEKVLELLAQLGKHILDYSVPLGPLRRLLR